MEALSVWGFPKLLNCKVEALTVIKGSQNKIWVTIISPNLISYKYQFPISCSNIHKKKNASVCGTGYKIPSSAFPYLP